MAKKTAVNFESYDFTANPQHYTYEEITTIRRMTAAGEPIYLAPIEIEIPEQLENLHITERECRTWRVGGFRYKVHLTPASGELYDMLVGDLRNKHSDAYRATRCQVRGARGKLIRCDTKNKCSECPYGIDPAEKEANIVSLDGLYEIGWEPGGTGDITAEKGMAAVEYAGIRGKMDAEDTRISQILEDYEEIGLTIAELQEKYNISRRRVFQLLSRAREIGQED